MGLSIIDSIKDMMADWLYPDYPKDTINIRPPTEYKNDIGNILTNLRWALANIIKKSIVEIMRNPGKNKKMIHFTDPSISDYIKTFTMAYVKWKKVQDSNYQTENTAKELFTDLRAQIAYSIRNSIGNKDYRFSVTGMDLFDKYAYEQGGVEDFNRIVSESLS